MKVFRTLLDYLTLGVIVTLPLPAQIANGQAIDAVPVMQDLNYIAAQVNANVPALIPTVSGITPFTPTLVFGGSSAGITYSVQTGAYFKFQNIVFFTLDIFLSSKGAAPGIAAITGLPFPINANFPIGSGPMASMLSKNITFADGYLAGLLSSGGNTVLLLNLVTGATWNVLTDAAFTNTSEVIMTGFYSA